MIVAVERRPTPCAVSCTSSHWPVVTLSGQSVRRTSSSRISAAVPGSEARPGVAEQDEVLVERQPERRRALPDLERGERVHVDPGHGLLHGAADLEVGLAGEARVDAALEADLGRAALPRLARAARDLAGRHDVRAAAQVRGEPALREGAEAAAEVADVRVVDVPRHDVGDDVAVHARGAARRRRRAPRRGRGRAPRAARSRPPRSSSAPAADRARASRTAVSATAPAPFGNRGNGVSTPAAQPSSRVRPPASDVLLTARATSRSHQRSTRPTYSG